MATADLIARQLSYYLKPHLRGWNTSVTNAARAILPVLARWLLPARIATSVAVAGSIILNHGEGAHVQHCQNCQRSTDGCSQECSFSVHQLCHDAAIVLRKARLCTPAVSAGMHASQLRLFSARLAVGIHAQSAPVPRSTARVAARQTSRFAVGSVSEHTWVSAMRLLWMVSSFWYRPACVVAWRSPTEVIRER